MYSINNTIPQLFHKSIEVKQKFADVANKALAKGLTQDEAIFAGLNSLPKTKFEPKAKPKLPSDITALLSLQNQDFQEQVHKAVNSLGKEITSITLNEDNRFIFMFDDGSRIVTNSLNLPDSVRQYVTIVAGGSDSSGGEVDLTEIIQAIEDLKASGEPTGFVTREDSTLSFNNNSRLLSITPTGSSFKVFLAGKAYDKTLGTVAIPDTNGLHFVYYDSADQVLKVTQVFAKEIITSHALVAIVYWNQVLQKAIYVADERHGIQMDGATHLYLHLTNGAVYRNGLGLSNMLVDGDGSLDTQAKLGIADGEIADEDIDHAISNNNPQQLSTVARLPLYYRLGENVWYKADASDYPLLLPNAIPETSSFTRPAYNKVTGSVWSIEEVTNNEFVLVHILATNDIYNPMISIVGGSYQTKSQAKDASLTELSSMQGLPFAEFVRVATVIYQTSNSYTNTPKARVISYDGTSQYIDWRTSKVNTVSGASSSNDPFKNDWERNPVFTYLSNSNLDRITYASGNYKQFNYLSNSNVDFIDYVRNTGKYRKTFNYTGSNLTSISYQIL